MPHNPVEASVSWKRINGVRDGSVYPVFQAEAAEKTEGNPPDDPFEPPEFPIPITTEDAPMNPPMVVIYRPVQYEEGYLDELGDISRPEPPLTTDFDQFENVRTLFEEVQCMAMLCLKDRDSVQSVNRGTCTPYVVDQTVFDTIRVGDVIRFRPSYSDSGTVTELLDRSPTY